MNKNVIRIVALVLVIAMVIGFFGMLAIYFI